VKGQLVLSLFPGLGLLDKAFEDEGFCVVRGPDRIWGGDVKKFLPPAGCFDGVIGGPPCQRFSQVNISGRKGKQPLQEDLIPEFERCVRAAAPSWFLMENVEQAPLPDLPAFDVRPLLFNNRDLGAEQNRVRRFTFGIDGAARAVNGLHTFQRSLQGEFVALENIDRSGCFTANGTQWEPGPRGKRGRCRSDRTVKELKRGLRLQGLSEDYLDDCPLTVEGAIKAVGNGVPLPMGRAVARAVKAALSAESEPIEERKTA